MKPTKWKLNTAAHVFGVSRTKLRSRLEAAGIPTGAGREFTTRQISRALYADANIQTAKYRRESAEADLAEIEVAKARRELAATADVVDILARVLRAFRKRLADLPANLGPAVNPSDPAHGTAAVRRWVDGVLPLLREDIVAVFAKGDLPNDDDEQEAEGVNAYDDHGNRILAAGFEYPDDEPRPADTQPAGLEAALNLVASLADASPPATIGARLLMLSYLAKLPGHPRTQRELARRLGVSVSRVNRLLRNLRGNLKDLWLPSEQATHR